MLKHLLKVTIWQQSVMLYHSVEIWNNPTEQSYKFHMRHVGLSNSQLPTVWSFSTLANYPFHQLKRSRSNVFPPRHPRNDAFLRFTHLASPNCFQASAGILKQKSKLRSFRFQDKRSSQRQSHGVTRHNSECSSSAAHLAKERRSTAAPLAPFVSRPKHLENICGMKSNNRMSLAFLYQRQPQKHHLKKSHEMQKIKAITAPCCLKLLNFAKV